MFLFFVKQKTAYEMRISDWSSDVCSSDLGLISDERLAKVTARISDRQRVVAYLKKKSVTASVANSLLSELGTSELSQNVKLFQLLTRPQDRKSVVKGKSVSTRVDLGGRRIIKKKKKNQTNNRIKSK